MNWKELFKFSVVDIIQVIAVIIGLYYTVQALQDTRKVESARIILEINRDLSSNKFSNISHKIEGGFDQKKHDSNVPILKESGGLFLDGELEDYLGIYNDIGELYQNGVLNDMVEGEFFYSAGKIWCNKDIRKYIQKIRDIDYEPKGAFAYYYGVEYLANKSLSGNNRTCADLDKQ
jgi:hypothetical protein